MHTLGRCSAAGSAAVVAAYIAAVFVPFVEAIDERAGLFVVVIVAAAECIVGVFGLFVEATDGLAGLFAAMAAVAVDVAVKMAEQLFVASAMVRLAVILLPVAAN